MFGNVNIRFKNRYNNELAQLISDEPVVAL